MIREIITSPGYQTEGYGQHPLEINFLVRGDEGVLVFTICTGWSPSYLREHQIGMSGSFSSFLSAPYCLCSFHAHPTLALCVDHDPHDGCSWLDGPCISHEPFGCTGKTLGDLFFALNFENLESFWLRMEKHYKEIVRDLH